MAKTFNSKIANEAKPDNNILHTTVEPGGEVRGEQPWFWSTNIERPVMTKEQRKVLDGIERHRNTLPPLVRSTEEHKDPDVTFDSKTDALQFMIEESKRDPITFPVHIQDEPLDFKIVLGNEKEASKTFNSKKIASIFLAMDEEDFDNPESVYTNPLSMHDADEEEEGPGPYLLLPNHTDTDTTSDEINDEFEGEQDKDQHTAEDADKVPCPSPPIGCGGMLKHNTIGNRIYTETHCPTCVNKDCRSREDDVASHCLGHKDGKSCSGRSYRKHIMEITRGNNKITTDVCPVCSNEGEIEAEHFEKLMRGGQPNNTKSDIGNSITSEEKTPVIVLEQNDDKPLGTNEDYSIGQGSGSVIAPQSSNTALFAEALTGHTGHYDLTPQKITSVTKDGKTVTHNKCGCERRNGLASDAQIQKIMNESDTNGYNEGILNIKRTTPQFVTDQQGREIHVRQQKINDFIKERYACPGDL